MVARPLFMIAALAWAMAGAGHAGERVENFAKPAAQRSDNRDTPILPPIRPGQQLTGVKPSEAEILRALPRVRVVPYIYDMSREDVAIVVEKVKESLSPPRFFPLIGPAQLHECHWKCTVHFTERVESAYPFPFVSRRPRVEVVFLDKGALHLMPASPNTN